jgi:hypothetical protein
MTSIPESIAKAIDAHATELIMLFWCIVLFAGYLWKPDQQLLIVLGGATGALYGVAEKRLKRSNTNIGNVEGDVETTTATPEPKE